MSVKERMTVTVDPELLQAGNEAVAEGRAESLSAWVNLALAEHAARDRRMRALGSAIADYESEAGLISAAELEAQHRADRAGATVIRGRRTAARRRTRPRRSG